MGWSAEDEAKYQAKIKEAQRMESQKLINPQGKGLSMPTTSGEMQSRIGQDKPLEEPAIDPIDVAVSMAVPGVGRAAKGVSKGLIDASEAIARLPGKAIDKGSNYALSKLAGLPEKQVQTYLENPALVRFFKKAPELEQQRVAEEALNRAQSALGAKSKGIEARLQSQIADKSIPGASIRPAMNYLNKGADAQINPALRGDLVTGQVPVSDAVPAMRDIAQNMTSWHADPVTGQLMRATDPEAEAAWKNLRQNVGSAAPEAQPSFDALRQNIEANKGIKAGNNRPLSLLSGGGDTAAARQLADELAGSDLDKTAQAYQAGKALNNKYHSGVVDRGLGVVGEGGMAAKAAIAPVTDLPGKAIGAAANAARVASNAIPGQGAVALNAVTPQNDDKLKQFLTGGSQGPAQAWSAEDEAKFQAKLRESQGR